ncbi:conjugal transfer protein TraG N-terminal domain-containing protein [Pseudomonas veronii]|uniref:conjugal transfer protein TraG N-terminal domain-containing protein n=1 Tax=Pseudomonas veronii TaxID=76761 RepID=UPI0021BF50E4|nr:conjugal transfer protein TraG N-terminal domain-containing protein [Pseudomonas veronii]MCT9827496.1 conjugal transfer protein TraG N-terminal domain-containing protein [Pseudomonas veronii]
MEFTIYSVGSAVYLEEVLNSVAMICGTGDIESLARIGFLIGALILGFQAVFNNTAIPFQKLLICLVLYMAMYGPSGRAVIEDVYDGEVAVVDNVPLGPLVVGSIISNIGYNLTNLFEQAFSTPAMTRYGFADPIETLMKVRSVTGNLMSIPSFTNGLGANKNLVNSWSNYFRECTLPMLGTDLQDYADLYRANDPMGAARFNSTVYYTQIFDGPAGGRMLNCSDAHTALVNLTDSATDNVMSEIATAGFKRPGKTVDPDAVTSRIGDSLYALNMSATDARAYTMSSVLYPIFLQAPGQKAVEDLQGSYGVMMGQAMAQQNTQWAAEGTQFTKYVRPFMTFFEGLIYAITPLMAFLITMGGFGIGLISKYLMLLAWMMLWMPALAIVNLYTVSSTASAMEAILQTSSFDVGGTGVSFEMLKQMGPALEQAIGVAGLMASSIPAICLFLVSGTAIAASGIAGRMNGSDQINEKIASPDVITPSAGLQTTPYATSDFDKGVRINGSENQRGNISVGSMLSETIQSSKATSEGSSQAFSKQFTSTMGRSLDNSKSIGEAADVGHSLQTSLGLDKSSGFQARYDSLRSQGYSANNIDAAIASVALSSGVDGKLGATAGAGVDGGPAGVKAGVSGGVGLSAGATGSSTDQTTRSDGQAYADTLSAVKSSGLGETVKSALQKTDGTTLAKNFQSADRSSMSKADQESLSQSAQKTINDQMAYQKVSGLANTYGYSEDMKLDSLTGKVINEGRDRAVVGDAMNKYGQEFQQNQQMFSQTMLDPNRANTAAALYTLAKHHDFEALTGATVDYDKNANLRSPSIGNLEAATNKAGHTVDTGAFDSRFNQEKTAAISDAHQNIGERHDRNDAIVQNDAEVYGKKALDPAAERAAGRIRGSASELNDRGESSFGILTAASNGIGAALGTRASREEYVQEGQQLGLNDAQADVFATARVGGITDNSKERWDNYAASNHMDKDLSEGMYKQLVEAGLNDNGSGGHLADILTLNQRDNVGADMASNSSIPRQEPVYASPPHGLNNEQGNSGIGFGGNAAGVGPHNSVQRPDLDRVQSSTHDVTGSFGQEQFSGLRDHGVIHAPEYPAHNAGAYQPEGPTYYPVQGQGHASTLGGDGFSNVSEHPANEAGVQHGETPTHFPLPRQEPRPMNFSNSGGDGMTNMAEYPGNGFGANQADILSLNHRDSSGLEGNSTPSQAKGQGADKGHYR